jgi:hypothetical protein
MYFELWYCDPLGNRISSISTAMGFQYTRVAGDVGVLSIPLPMLGKVYENTNPDFRIHLYYQPYGGSLKLEIVAFLDRFDYSTAAGGLNQINLGGSDLNILLKNKIIANPAGSTGATFSGGYTTNQMTLLARRTIGGSTTGNRDLTDYGIVVPGTGADIDLGPAIEKSAAWKNALVTLQDMQSFSKDAGQEIFFGIVPKSETIGEFRTAVNQWGADRTYSSNNPIVFSEEYGNLSNPVLSYDYVSEKNYIYAGGQGKGDDRIVGEAEDSAATGRSPFSRKEKFINVTTLTTANAVEDAAEIHVQRHRKRIVLRGDIISNSITEYGKDWNMGDRITIFYQGKQIDAIVRAVLVKLDNTGKLNIQGRVESV